jgi:hypothetical protein
VAIFAANRILSAAARDAGVVTILLISILSPVRTLAATYYVNSLVGDDSATGADESSPWKSLARADRQALNSGDRLLLKGGEIYSGTLILSDSKTTGRPIHVDSYGTGRATIDSEVGPAIVVKTGGIEIQRIDLVSKVTKSLPGNVGLRIDFSGAKGLRNDGIKISDMDIGGFGDDGVNIHAPGPPSVPLTDIRIDRVVVHDCASSGLSTGDGTNGLVPVHGIQELTIVNSVFRHNMGGTGIVLGGVQGGLVEFCVSSSNTGRGGGVGIWAWESNNVVFRYDISFDTHSHGKDGGGFDLDGACNNCLVDHCLSYDNDGPGYMHCDYPTAGPTRGNEMRSSISFNDGRFSGDNNCLGFGFVTWGSGLDKCVVDHNLVVFTTDNPHKNPGGCLFVDYLAGYGGAGDVQHVTGCIVDDNTVVITGAGAAAVSDDMPAPTIKDVLFENNRYVTSGGASMYFVWGTDRYASLDGWNKATGEEPSRRGRYPGGQELLPIVANLNYKLTDARAIKRFSLMLWLDEHNSSKSLENSAGQ